MAKSTQVQIRVTEEEKSTLKAAADEEGLSLSEFLLNTALAVARGQKRRPPRAIPYAVIGKVRVPVRDLLKVPIVMVTEERE